MRLRDPIKQCGDYRQYPYLREQLEPEFPRTLSDSDKALIRGIVDNAVEHARRQIAVQSTCHPT